MRDHSTNVHCIMHLSGLWHAMAPGLIISVPAHRMRSILIQIHIAAIWPQMEDLAGPQGLSDKASWYYYTT